MQNHVKTSKQAKLYLKTNVQYNGTLFYEFESVKQKKKKRNLELYLILKKDIRIARRSATNYNVREKN